MAHLRGLRMSRYMDQLTRLTVSACPLGPAVRLIQLRFGKVMLYLSEAAHRGSSLIKAAGCLCISSAAVPRSGECGQSGPARAWAKGMHERESYQHGWPGICGSVGGVLIFSQSRETCFNLDQERRTARMALHDSGPPGRPTLQAVIEQLSGAKWQC